MYMCTATDGVYECEASFYVCVVHDCVVHRCIRHTYIYIIYIYIYIYIHTGVYHICTIHVHIIHVVHNVLLPSWSTIFVSRLALDLASTEQMPPILT